MANELTREKIYKEFGIAISTIKKGEKLRTEKGSLEKKQLKRIARIYQGEKLQAYITENLGAFLREIAEPLGGSVTGVFNALKREKITYKEGGWVIAKPYTVYTM